MANLRKFLYLDRVNDRPPFFRRWRTVYLLVLGNLLVLIVLFYLLTLRYA